MDDGNWSEAIHDFNGCLEERLSESPSARFEQYEDRASQLLNQRARLTSRMSETMDPPDEFDDFEDLLNASQSELVEELSRQDVSPEIRQSVRSFLDERQELVFSFWNDMRDVLPDVLESVEELDQTEILEQFRDVTDDLLMNQLKEPLEENIYDENVPTGEVKSRRDELLDRAIQERDFDRIKRHSSLPESVIEQYHDHYRTPEDLNKWQKKLLDLYSTLIERLILALRVPRDTVDRYLHEFNQIYESESKLFSLFLQPPDPEHYHLTHAFNTTLLSLMVGEEIGLPERAQKTLLLGGTLADVGLLVIPDSFYLVDDELSRERATERDAAEVSE